MPRKSALLGVMKDKQFQAAVAKFPRLSDTGVAVARAILVNGEPPAAVAARLGIHRSQAHQWATKVFEGQRGWVTETVSLPELAMRKVRAMAKSERSREATPAARRG